MVPAYASRRGRRTTGPVQGRASSNMDDARRVDEIGYMFRPLYARLLDWGLHGAHSYTQPR